MTSEAPSTSGQQFYKDAAHVLSSGRNAAERNENNICIQTGEEFSTEFLRDRVALRRLPVISEGEQHQPKRVDYKFNQNHQLVYEDLTGILGLQRIDSEHSLEFSELVPVTGFGTEAENKAYTDNINRYHWEYGAIGQVPGKFADESNPDQVTPGPNAPPVYVVESPHSYYTYGTEFSEGSFSGKMKVLCSFGGRILPRPSDGKLRYVGGETRIISIRKNITWEELTNKISGICNQPHTIKYQLPGEDLDALISVCSDEDLYHMIDEYQELERIQGSHRLRIFLVSSESPSSVEGRAAQPSDADYQYVFAVNATVDRSPRKSSSGQSLTSQTCQFGNTSDYSPTFHRDSPTSAFPLEIKDCTPSFSNLAGMFSKPASRFLTKLQIPRKSFNQTPPISPVQHRDPTNSNVQIYGDRKRCDGHQSIIPYVIENRPCENPYSLDAMGYYNNLPHGLPLTNYHHPNEYLVETDQVNKSQDRHFHHRSPSKDFVHSPSYCQSDINYDRKVLKERAFHSDMVAFNPDDPMGLRSRLNDIDVSHHKIMHAFSDSQLQEYGERSNCYSPLSSCTEREKSPSLAMSNFPPEWRVQCEERINEKQQMNKYENQPTSKMPGDCKGNVELGQEMFNWTDRNITCSHHKKKHLERNVEVSSHDNAKELEKLPDLNYLPCVCLSSQEQQNLRGGISASSVISSETSSHGYRLEAMASKFLIKSQTSDKDKQCATTETLSIQAVSDGYPGLLPVASQGLDDQESMDPSCVSMSPFAETNFFPKFKLYKNNTSMYALFQKTTTGAVLSGEAPLCNTDSLNHPDYQVQMVGLSQTSFEGAKFGEVVCLQSQLSDSHPENKMESVVSIKDIIDCTPPGIPFTSTVVPRIEDEACDDFPSPRKSEAENATLGSECEVKNFTMELEFSGYHVLW